MALITRSSSVVVFAAFVAIWLLPFSAFSQKAVEKPLARPKAVASPTPAKTAPPEVLTSVSQIQDVKPPDVHFEALQMLIERYGIGGLTRNKLFNGSSNLTGSDLEIIDRNARDMIAMYLAAVGLPPAEKKKYEPLRCPLDTKRLMFTEKAVADYLQCSFIPADLADLKPTAATLTRSRYVIFLAVALANVDVRLSELEAKALKAREDAKKAATPAATPTPRPPVRLIEISNRPGDFWNFVPGTWDADLAIGDKKAPRSNWRFSQRSGNEFTLTLDIYSPNPQSVRVRTVKKAGTHFDPEHHRVNFEYSGYRFEGYIIVGGALKGDVFYEGKAIGTWTAYRRVDVDYANLAAEAAKRKRNDDAIGYYSKAIEIKPTSGHHLNRGNIQFIEKQYEYAVNDYTLALFFDTSSEILYNRSLAYFNLKRYREAADDATRIITQFMPTLDTKRRSAVYLQRGWCHIGLNNKNAAIADFREALRIDPSSATARTALTDLGVQP